MQDFGGCPAEGLRARVGCRSCEVVPHQPLGRFEGSGAHLATIRGIGEGGGRVYREPRELSVVG